jgi:hypothetical protein
MPHKHNADRRHHILKMSFKVRNWPEYEAGLRRLGSPALWIEDTALECWPTCGTGGQPRYLDAAVQASLMRGTALKLPLRQTESLLASVLTLMKLTISAPDHTTVSNHVTGWEWGHLALHPASAPTPTEVRAGCREDGSFAAIPACPNMMRSP